MTYTADVLMKLLPVVYQLRDDKDGALRGLMDLLAREADVVDGDIARLYENWFIETCDEWVIPYIGDLLGARRLHGLGGEAFSARARVANTLLYRQRKGTPAMLEQLARDTTGWSAKVTEFFQLLGVTQCVNHRRLWNHRTPDLRNASHLELLESPFDDIAHSADVRHIASRRGRHNIRNIGIFLWRLQSYFVTRSRAAVAGAVNDGRFFVNPLKVDTPLLNRVEAETDTGSLAGEVNVPGRLRSRPLYAELEARRQAIVDGRDPVATYFDETPTLRVWLDGQAVDPAEITICDLTDPAPPIPDGWFRPPAQKTYVRSGTATSFARNIKVGVDPRRGRLALPAGAAVGSVEVAYAYGFSGDVGAGPFDRRPLLHEWIEGGGRRINFQIGVTKDAALIAAAPDPNQLTTSIGGAVAKWAAFAGANPGSFGLIAVMDSDSYAEDLTGASAVEIPSGCALAIVAADWPVVTSLAGDPARLTGSYVPNRLRPHLRGNMSIRGKTGGTLKGELIIDGLLLEGRMTVLVGDLGTLRLGHVSMPPPTAAAPDRGRLSVNASSLPGAQNTDLTIEIRRSICGPIDLPNTVDALTIVDSIVASTSDGSTSAVGVNAAGVTTNVQRSTIFGTIAVRDIESGNSIYTGVVTAVRRQTGCVRFCHVPDGSKTPRRYRCQPDLALKAEPDAAKHPGIRLRVSPSFTSTEYGDPGYAQISSSCASEIRSGAEDGSEMGVFSYLRQPLREVNLESSLDEYLRFGLEAGISFVS